MMAEKELNREQIAKAIAEYFEPEYQPIVEQLLKTYSYEDDLIELIDYHKKFIETNSDKYLEDIFDKIHSIAVEHIKSSTWHRLPEDWTDTLLRQYTINEVLDIVNFIESHNLDDDEVVKLIYGIVTGYFGEIPETKNELDDIEFYPNMTLEELAEELIDEGVFGECAEKLKSYIDFEKLANDLRIDGYDEVEGLGVFRTS